MPKPTQITIADHPAALTFDRHARFRYGRHGGNLNALLSIPGQDYFQTLLLIWASLDDKTRARYPDPAMLVDEFGEEDERFESILAAVVSAGWVRLDRQSAKE